MDIDAHTVSKMTEILGPEMTPQIKAALDPFGYEKGLRERMGQAKTTQECLNIMPDIPPGALRWECLNRALDLAGTPGECWAVQDRSHGETRERIKPRVRGKVISLLVGDLQEAVTAEDYRRIYLQAPQKSEIASLAMGKMIAVLRCELKKADTPEDFWRVYEAAISCNDEIRQRALDGILVFADTERRLWAVYREVCGNDKRVVLAKILSFADTEKKSRFVYKLSRSRQIVPHPTERAAHEKVLEFLRIRLAKARMRECWELHRDPLATPLFCEEVLERLSDLADTIKLKWEVFKHPDSSPATRERALREILGLGTFAELSEIHKKLWPCHDAIKQRIGAKMADLLWIEFQKADTQERRWELYKKGQYLSGFGPESLAKILEFATDAEECQMVLKQTNNPWSPLGQESIRKIGRILEAQSA